MGAEIRSNEDDSMSGAGVSSSRCIDETNRCLDSQFKWIITIMLAMTGILIAVIKF